MGWVRGAAKPVRKELVFFLLVYLMLIQQPIEWICITYDNRWFQFLKFLQGLLIEFGVVYAATCLVYFTRSRIVKGVLYLLFWLLMGITFFLAVSFNMSISQQTLTVLVETNPNESAEFINTYLWTPKSILTYVIDLVVLLLIIVAEWKRKAIVRGLRQVLNVRFMEYLSGALGCCGTVLMLVAYVSLFCCCNSSTIYHWRNVFPPDSLDPFSQSLHAINSLRAFDNDVDFAMAQARKVYTTRATVADSDSLTVVYVLGESYNKHHASIYGYDKPTTPNMAREQVAGNLFVFNDVISQENVTSVVEKNTFSLNSVGDGEYWFDTPNFTTVFRRAGYDVWMWDMQRTYMEKRLFTITVNSYIYNPELARLSYTAFNDTTFTFDGELIDDFAKNAKITGKYNLVVFHLMGQHVSFRQRFPKDSEFDRFRSYNYKNRKADYLNKEKRWMIAQYDNATLYNDYVLEKIFNLYRNKNAVVVYMSDHGEEVYDFRNRQGRYMTHNPEPDALRHQNEVPFVIWCSDRYKELHSDAVNRIKAAVNRPFMTDRVGFLLMDLGTLQTPYYKAENDLISPQYKPKKRFIYDHADYDEIMRSSKQ